MRMIQAMHHNSATSHRCKYGIIVRKWMSHWDDVEVTLQMTNEDTLRALAEKLAGAIPQNVKTAGEDIERNFRQVLRSGLGKLDLVSREEFDVQVAVLARTRQKLETLQAELAAMEASTDD